MQLCEKHYFLFLFFFLLILPLASVLLRPNMIGFDSYAFLSAICNKTEFPELAPVSKLIFENLPCDFVFLKIITWIFYASLIGVIAFLGYHFLGKAGLLAPLFAWLSTYWLVLPWELENDFLAMPFLWLSYLLFFKNHKICAVLLVLFTGYFIWGGAWFFLFALGIMCLPILLIGLLVLGLNFSRIASTILPNTIVMENMLFSGFICLFFACIGWVGLKKNVKLEKLMPLALFFIPIAFLSGKYAYHALPILAIGVAGVYDLFEGKLEKLKIPLLAGTLTMFFILSTYGIYTTFPKQGTLESVNHALQLGKDKNKQVLNDWELGYFLEFQKYPTKYKGFLPNPDYNNAKNAIIVSQFDLNFKKIKNYGLYTIYEVD